AQENVVPQYGIVELRSRYPKTTGSIGTKQMSRTAGVWTTTSEIVGPRPEVSVWAGAMQEMPMTAPPMATILPAESPFELSSVVVGDECLLLMARSFQVSGGRSGTMIRAEDSGVKNALGSGGADPHRPV